jgi:hypothetical protein
MAGVWWFLVGARRAEAVRQDELRRQVLRDYGLDRVLEDVRRCPDHCIAADVDRGPGDQPGMVLYPIPVSGDVPQRPGYEASREWRRVSRSAAAGVATPPELWVGYDCDDPPGPADMERRILVGGYPIEDACGQTWHVPVLRAVDNPRGRLSAAFKWDEEDRPRIGVDPRYGQLWEQSARVWDLIDRQSNDTGAVFGQDFDAATDEFLFGFLLECLGINYRADNAVWALIDRVRPGWLSQEAASWMLNATVDLFKYRAFLAAQKKTPSS